MFLVIGELRKVLDNAYKDKSGKMVPQAILVIEPELGRQNIEVYLSSKQMANLKDWQALKGKPCAVMASLYVNHDLRFYKLNAIGEGKPQHPPTAQ